MKESFNKKNLREEIAEFYDNLDDETVDLREHMLEGFEDYSIPEAEFSNDSHKVLTEFVESITPEQVYEMRKLYIHSRGEGKL